MDSTFYEATSCTYRLRLRGTKRYLINFTRFSAELILLERIKNLIECSMEKTKRFIEVRQLVRVVSRDIKVSTQTKYMQRA